MDFSLSISGYFALFQWHTRHDNSLQGGEEIKGPGPGLESGAMTEVATSHLVTFGGALLALALVWFWKINRRDQLFLILDAGDWWPEMTHQFCQTMLQFVMVLAYMDLCFLFF